MGSKWHENKTKLSNCKNILDEKSCQLTCLTALCPGPKTIWILLKQETVSGSGISWATCKSVPRSRQIITPALHYSLFYRPDALPATQPTASKHWRQTNLSLNSHSIESHNYFLSQVGIREALLCWFYTIRQKSQPWCQITSMAKDHGTLPKLRYSRWLWFCSFLAALDVTSLGKNYSSLPVSAVVANGLNISLIHSYNWAVPANDSIHDQTSRVHIQKLV